MAQGKPRDPRKERQWRRSIREWGSSGLSVRAFCERHGLSEASFYAWRRELERRRPTPATFVPVHVVAEEPRPSGGTLELVLPGNRCVRIAPGFDAATLRQLLAVLEDQPC